MNDSENNYIIGIVNFVTKIETFTAKNLIIFFKLLRRFSIFAFYQLKELLEFVFNKENRKTSILTVIIFALIMKIFQTIKNLKYALNQRKIEIDLEVKENNILYDHAVKNNESEIVVNKTDFNNILLYYALDLENNNKKILNDNIQKITKAVDNQNKYRHKLNLSKESMNTPFYNILKLYINDILKKN